MRADPEICTSAVVASDIYSLSLYTRLKCLKLVSFRHSQVAPRTVAAVQIQGRTVRGRSKEVKWASWPPFTSCWVNVKLNWMTRKIEIYLSVLIEVVAKLHTVQKRAGRQFPWFLLPPPFSCWNAPFWKPTSYIALSVAWKHQERCFRVVKWEVMPAKNRLAKAGAPLWLA